MSSRRCILPCSDGAGSNSAREIRYPKSEIRKKSEARNPKLNSGRSLRCRPTAERGDLPPRSHRSRRCGRGRPGGRRFVFRFLRPVARVRSARRHLQRRRAHRRALGAVAETRLGEGSDGITSSSAATSSARSARTIASSSRATAAIAATGSTATARSTRWFMATRARSTLIPSRKNRCFISCRAR